MKRLKEQHSTIANIIGRKKVAFLDCPVYFNFGDLLIWHGTEKFFKDYNINVSYRSEATYINQKEIDKCDVIVFQGGGNFGDLYPRVQAMRENVVKNNRNKKIICLPQTIHFSSEGSLNRSSEIFKNHPDFIFFIRDESSKILAMRFTDKVSMMPDMAHSLHPLVEPYEAGYDANCTKILVQKRDDGEVGNMIVNGLSKRPFDWNDLVTIEDKVVRKLFNMVSKLGVNQNKLISLWAIKSRELELRAISVFEHKNHIVTDRLHGMILSALLGKSCKVFDNSYGKNSGYYESWLKNIPFIDFNRG
ncbi:polysaccharide pyruvyl transferase family protein [Vibrio sp. PNB22_3_1]